MKVENSEENINLERRVGILEDNHRKIKFWKTNFNGSILYYVSFISFFAIFNLSWFLPFAPLLGKVLVSVCSFCAISFLLFFKTDYFEEITEDIEYKPGVFVTSIIAFVINIIILFSASLVCLSEDEVSEYVEKCSVMECEIHESKHSESVDCKWCNEHRNCLIENSKKK